MGTNAGEIVLDTDFAAIKRAGSAKPMVRLIQNAAQSIPHNTATALTWDAEEYDTDGYHSISVNTSRITPLRAGYYRLTATYAAGSRTDFNNIEIVFQKTGNVAASRVRVGPNNFSASKSVQNTATLTADGVTDYFEVLVLHQNTAAAAQNSGGGGGSFSPTFECEFLRDL